MKKRLSRRQGQQLGRGIDDIDLSYDGGKLWNLSHPGKVHSDRTLFTHTNETIVIIELPMPNVSSGEVDQGVYRYKIMGSKTLSLLLSVITSIYKEFSVGTISATVNGLVKVKGLEKIRANYYRLVLVSA